jgi:VanZ family protein
VLRRPYHGWVKNQSMGRAPQYGSFENKSACGSGFSNNLGAMIRFRLERLFRLLTWACVVLLAVLSLTPGDYMVRTGVAGDLEHFVAYFGTGLIASLGYSRRLGYRGPAALLCGYAGFLEIGQNWAPGRHADFIDFASSSAGVIAGMLLSWVWDRISSFFRPRKRT